ncbi:MAG: hypothetical protein ACKOEM_10465, partial [Planctomycetia bacterium]
QAVAQTKVLIGHFGDPVPYKALIADGSLERATGWKIELRQFASGAEVNAPWPLAAFRFLKSALLPWQPA